MGGKIGVLIKVGFRGEPRDRSGLASLAKDLAMQVAASAPIAVAAGDVSAAVVEKEREIAREVTAKEMQEKEKEGKKVAEDMLDRIVEGKLGKFFKENCLLQQVFIKDGKTTVEKLLTETAKSLGVENLGVLAFHRLQLGQ